MGSLWRVFSLPDWCGQGNRVAADHLFRVRLELLFVRSELVDFALPLLETLIEFVHRERERLVRRHFGLCRGELR